MRTVWRFLASTELTIILAILICVDAGIGSFYTVKHPEFYRSLDQGILLPALAASGSKGFSFTFWIYGLILLVALFSLNTTLCTVDRLYTIVKKGRPWYAICPHIVHIGFLIAVLGHLAGSAYGFKSPYNFLMKGRASELAEVPGLSVRLDNVDIKVNAEGKLESLKTELTLFEDGKEVKSGFSRINGPLIYKGIAFYHMNQGTTTTGIVLEAETRRMAVDFGGSFTLASGASFKLGHIYPDFFVDEDGKAASRSRQYRNPHIEIFASDGTLAFMDLATPGLAVRLGESEVRLVDYIDSEYVIMSISRDPGMGIIIAGSSVLVLGMIMVFIFRGRRSELVRV